MRRSAKNGYLLHYLHSAAAARCVNTLLGNSCFHFLYCIRQTYVTSRAASRVLCGRGVCDRMMQCNAAWTLIFALVAGEEHETGDGAEDGEGGAGAGAAP